MINVVISVNDGESQTEGLRQRAGRLRTGVYGVADPEKLAAAAGLYDQIYEPHEGDRQARRAAEKWFGETYDNLPTEAITSPEQFHKLAGL